MFERMKGFFAGCEVGRVEEEVTPTLLQSEQDDTH